MTTNPLVKKLQIKAGHNVLIINSPENYTGLLDPLPDNARLHADRKGKFNVIQLFVKDSKELEKSLEEIKDLLQDTILWITYPKKSSGITSDLDMMSAWKGPEKYGLRPVASAAINEVWTALRFKPADLVKKSEISNSAIQKNKLGKYIDVKNRIIHLPEDVKSELELNPPALACFSSLGWSHRKEYMTWILSAKQEKTRINRIKKAVEMLAAGKKNPSSK